jgi:hypothetical protein
MKLEFLDRESPLLASVYDGERHLSEFGYELVGRNVMVPEFALPGCKDVSSMMA